MKEPLQQLLQQQNLPAETCEKFLLILDNCTRADDKLAALTEQERGQLETVTRLWQNELLEKQREANYLLMRVSKSGDDDLKFEYQEKVIRDCINNYLKKYRKMPSIRKIAEETGINRRTITKHMIEEQDRSEERLQQVNYMSMELLGNLLYKSKMSDDTKAAKLFLDNMNKMMKQSSKASGSVNLNGFILTQQKVDMMNMEEIEKIVELWRE